MNFAYIFCAKIILPFSGYCVGISPLSSVTQVFFQIRHWIIASPMCMLLQNKKSLSKYFCGQWNGGNAKMKKRTHRTWEIEYSQIKSEDEEDEKFLSLFTFVIWCARFELGIVTQTGTKHQQQRLKYQLECLMLLLLYVVF